MSPSDLSEPGPLILALDTTAAHCAAALVSGDRALAARTELMDRGQAERLMPLAEALLAEAGAGWGDLDAVAVCTGPGNFTGIRIAVAAARGIALGLGRPAIGVTRLEALAEGVAGGCLVTLDAGRGAAWVQAFRDGAALGPAEMAQAARLPEIAPDLPRVGWAAGADQRADPAAIARIARGRIGRAGPPPAPLYLRHADAAPPSEAPPRLLDDA